MPSFHPNDRLQSWGRITRQRQWLARPQFEDELSGCLADARENGRSLLATGFLRSYGDSNLNPGGAVVDMTGLDRVHFFDRDRGIVRADAGLSLDALIRFALPHGFFPPVVPGTRFVTLGGAIANDVHGKNHHGSGTLGTHVRSLGLLRSDGSRHELGPDDLSGRFAATVGGLGLTGAIEWAEIAMKRVEGSSIDAETIPFGTLEEFFSLSEESLPGHEYTVSWIDCTRVEGSKVRGIFSRGNHAPDRTRRLHAGRPRLSVPFNLPRITLNPLTLRVFNDLYYRYQSVRSGRTKTAYSPFFFPLDGIMNWNRLYGHAGMYQYQCVVPPSAALAATAELLARIARSGDGSFLAVLKTFGDRASPGMLSFPMEGTTLALDFRNRGPKTLALLARLDDVVREAGGRLYPAKDGRMSAAMLESGYPRLAEFAAHVDPHFSSAFWRRVAP